MVNAPPRFTVLLLTVIVPLLLHGPLMVRVEPFLVSSVPVLLNVPLLLPIAISPPATSALIGPLVDD